MTGIWFLVFVLNVSLHKLFTFTFMIAFFLTWLDSWKKELFLYVFIKRFSLISLFFYITFVINTNPFIALFFFFFTSALIFYCNVRPVDVLDESDDFKTNYIWYLLIIGILLIISVFFLYIGFEAWDYFIVSKST